MYKKFFTGFILLLFLLLANLNCLAENLSSPIKVFHLKNGQTIVIKEVHTNPIVTVDTWVKTGSINENDQNNGVSHFLEHLLFKGTKNHKNGEIEKILESKGATFNAATSKDFTHFYITIASQYVETALNLHADMLLNTAIPQDELDKERKVVQEEIRRAEDNPDRILFSNLNSILFKTHPYKYETLGSLEIVGNIPREKILNYYTKWYIPANMTTVVVGDVDTNKILNLINKDFKFNSNNNKLISKKYSVEPYIHQKIEKVKKGNYNGGYVEIAFKGVSMSNKKDNYALDLAAALLGGGNSSRLYQNIKEKLNLVSSVSAGHYSMKDDSIFYVESTFQPENYPLVKDAIIKEIQKLRQGKISEEELQRAKTQIQRQFLYSNESVQNIANSVGYCMTIGGSLDYYTEYVNETNKITKDDVQKAVKKYLTDSSMAISALLPEEKIDAASKNQENYKNIAKSVLNNGMTLITEKNDLNDIISLSVFVKGGKLIEPVPGVSNIIVSALMQGTVNRSALDISKELEDSGIEITPVLGKDYFEIELKSVSSDFDKALEILIDILKNPVLENKYILKSKNDIIQSIKSSRDEPFSEAFEKFNRIIYPEHPYGYVGEVLEKSLPLISRENVLDFYKKSFVPENMVISVSGKVDHESLKEKFSAFFQKSDSKGINLNNNLTKFKPLKQNEFTCVKKDTAAAWMILGWTANGILQDKEYASFKIINAILGNGLSSRLFVNLREKQGLAYAIGSIYSARLDNSFFVLYIGTEPKNIKSVKNSFLEEINEIKNKSVNEEELNETKQKLIGKFALSQETNQQRAHNLGLFEILGKGYKFNYEYPDLINSITAKDIMETANKYFNNPYAISIVAPKGSIEDLEKEYKSESKR
ncbi:MAG: pitrilysin family protein [bacterium]